MSDTQHASPLRYPGGKGRLAPFLIEVLKANGLKRPHYVEPYAGGAGAALHLLFDEYVETITINDADDCIRCMWFAITHHNERFLEAIQNVPVSIRQWTKQRRIYKARDTSKPFELGFATFFLNRTSRSGIVRDGGPIGGHDQTGRFLVDARFYRDSLCERIERIGRYRHRILVTNRDGLSLLRQLNRRRHAIPTFAFIDPPYFVKGAQLYMNAFKPEQHEALAGFLTAPVGFSWVMTYDNVPAIRKLYSGMNTTAFDLSYSAFERRAGEELLIYPDEVAISRHARKALREAA
ncbi:MAG: DNA adenine methylase [Phycisphaerales bacterium]